MFTILELLLPSADSHSYRQPPPVVTQVLSVDAMRAINTYPLPSAVQLYILSLLPPNERVLSGRLVGPDARHYFSDDTTASLALPLPPHAAPSAQEAGQQYVQQLPFRHKLQLLCTAATSGSEVNLEVAWALLQPSIFPELLHSRAWVEGLISPPQPGSAVVKAGNPHLLGWLLQHCPALLRHTDVLQAAAKHCDLAGLQAAWVAMEADQTADDSARRDLGQQVLDAAAGSSTPDAMAKVEWASNAGRCSLQGSTAAAAASSGDLARLQYLHNRGCPMDGLPVLESALRHGGLAVAQWLVDEAGARLPGPQLPDNVSSWSPLLQAAVRGPSAVAKLQWLLERGAPLTGLRTEALYGVLDAAVEAGHAETLQYLKGLHEAAGQHETFHRVLNFTWPRSVAMAEHLRNAGVAFTTRSYEVFALTHDLAMFRWLAHEAGVSAAEVEPWMLTHVVSLWPCATTADTRDLLETVQLLVEAGHHSWDADMAMYYAVTRGDLPLARYILQQKPEYEPDSRTLLSAMEGGCEPLLEWLAAGQPQCLASSDGTPYLSAAQNGDKATLVALRRLGVPWDVDEEFEPGPPRTIVGWAVAQGCNAPALRWLVEQGAPVGAAGSIEEVLAAAELRRAELGR